MKSRLEVFAFPCILCVSVSIKKSVIYANTDIFSDYNNHVYLLIFNSWKRAPQNELWWRKEERWPTFVRSVYSSNHGLNASSRHHCCVVSELWCLCICKGLWSTEIKSQTWSKVCSNTTLDPRIATCRHREEVSSYRPLIQLSHGHTTQPTLRAAAVHMLSDRFL